MLAKSLGSTESTLPEIGLGTWLYKGDKNVIHKALELGSNFLDTAEMYNTESFVGDAVKNKRQSYFIATKVSPQNLRHQDLIAAADRSLRRLKTDYIDLYQVHWANPDIPIEESMGAMKDLVIDGKVRYVGVSNFSVQQTETARLALGSVPLVSNQVLYSLFDREIEDELIPYCSANQITVISYSPLAQGKIDPMLKRSPHLREIIDRICSEVHKTRAQVLLNWCTYLPCVVTIPQTNRVERVDENCGASGWRLTESQYEALNQASSSS